MTRKFELERTSRTPVDLDELLADLRRTAKALGQPTVGQKAYSQNGRYDFSTIARRFGSWNEALIAAGLEVSNRVGIDDEALFENILNLWTHFGRQPRRRDLASSQSTISQSPYNRRFGSWTKALEDFVDYANRPEAEHSVPASPISEPRRTGRDPSLRLRWNVLKRDRFTCVGCGASPANVPGLELHVDHVIAWSRGGETVLENLQTLCEPCNLGKSNT